MVGDKSINIVEKATGGPWGGTAVNELFTDFLCRFWGDEVIKQFKAECFSDHLLLLRAFENKKRLINTKDKVPLCLTYTRNFKRIYEKIRNEKFLNCSVKKEFNNHIEMEGYTMKISSDYIYQNFFKAVVDSIVQTSNDILKKQIKRKVSSVAVVGGLSQCEPLIEEMRNGLPVPVFVPTDAGLAVLKGAVLFGHDKNVIKQRICKYTYGIKTMRKFQTGDNHDENKVVWEEGKRWVKDCFRVFYEANQPIKLGDVRKHELQDFFTDSSRIARRTQPIKCDLYYTSASEPRYITDDGCKLLGKILVQPPKEGFPERWEGTVEMEFSGTEIVGRIRDKFDTTTMRFDFLT